MTSSLPPLAGYISQIHVATTSLKPVANRLPQTLLSDSAYLPMLLSTLEEPQNKLCRTQRAE